MVYNENKKERDTRPSLSKYIIAIIVSDYEAARVFWQTNWDSQSSENYRQSVRTEAGSAQ